MTNSCFYSLFPLLLSKPMTPKHPRNRYPLATRNNLNYVRFAMVLFIVGFVLSSVVDTNAFSKCMQVYKNSDICYKLNWPTPAHYPPRPPRAGFLFPTISHAIPQAGGQVAKNFWLYWYTGNLLINHRLKAKILQYNNTTILL